MRREKRKPLFSANVFLVQAPGKGNIKLGDLTRHDYHNKASHTLE